MKKKKKKKKKECKKEIQPFHKYMYRPWQDVTCGYEIGTTTQVTKQNKCSHSVLILVYIFLPFGIFFSHISHTLVQNRDRQLCYPEETTAQENMHPRGQTHFVKKSFIVLSIYLSWLICLEFGLPILK